MSRPISGLLVVALMAAAGTVAMLAGCRQADSQSNGDATHGQAVAHGDKLDVIAGIPPLAFIVRRIGGEHVNVGVLVQPGQDPHVFEPTPRQVLNLSKAQLFFRIGMPFESELLKRIELTGRPITVVDATIGIPRRSMAEEELDGEAGHDKAEEGHGDAEHGHAAHDHAGEPDPHIWLTPKALDSMAGQIAEALGRADPAHRTEYEQNRASLSAELQALDARIGRAMAPFRGHTFYVFHPAFGYFADAYALKQKSVEMEGKSPSPRRLRTLEAQARADGVKLIFAQPQFDTRTAQVVADSIGGMVVLIDPMAENVVANLADVTKKIEGSFTK